MGKTNNEEMRCISCDTPIIYKGNKMIPETKMCGWCDYALLMFDEDVTWPKLKSRIQKSEDPGLKTYIVKGPYAETSSYRGYPVRPYFDLVYARDIEINGIKIRKNSVAYSIFI